MVVSELTQITVHYWNVADSPKCITDHHHSFYRRRRLQDGNPDTAPSILISSRPQLGRPVTSVAKYDIIISYELHLAYDACRPTGSLPQQRQECCFVWCVQGRRNYVILALAVCFAFTGSVLTGLSKWEGWNTDTHHNNTTTTAATTTTTTTSSSITDS